MVVLLLFNQSVGRERLCCLRVHDANPSVRLEHRRGMLQQLAAAVTRTMLRVTALHHVE